MLVGLPGALEQVIHVRKQWRTALPVFTTPILCFLCWKGDSPFCRSERSLVRCQSGLYGHGAELTVAQAAGDE